MSDDTSALREALADLEHDRWSRWMRYLFTCGTFDSDGAFTIAPDKVTRWWRQMHVGYPLLTEREKDSDRQEADKTLALLRRETSGARAR